MTTSAIVTEGFGFSTALIVTEGFSPGTTPTPSTPTPGQPGVGGGGGRRRRHDRTVLPQQVIDDLAALYRSLYAARKNLPPELLREVADLVGFFAESYDGRLPPPEAVHFRDMAEYPDIDLSALGRAADAIIARSAVVEKVAKDFTGQAGWAAATVRQAGSVERAIQKFNADAARAARQAADQEEEDALLALLMVLD